MTCWEYKRKKLEEKKEMVNRLDSYFSAVDQDKVKQYHEKRGRKEEKSGKQGCTQKKIEVEKNVR